MHIFGVTLVCAFRNLKCSSIGWLEKPILPVTRIAARLGLHALELDAVVEFVDLDVVEHAVEIEMPPGAAEFAVGRELQPDLFLLLDDLLDLAVLDFLELGRGDLAFLALGAGILDRRGAQNAADMIGAKWRFSPLCHHFLRDWPASCQRVLIASSHSTAGAVPSCGGFACIACGFKRPAE